MIRRAAALVNPSPSRYPAPMEPLTLDTLRTLAAAQGLDLTDEELAGLLPLVKASRSMMDSLRGLSPEIEPSSQYRIL